MKLRIPLILMLLLVGSVFAQEKLPVTPAGQKLVEFYDSLNVDKLWIAGKYVDWKTGVALDKPVTDNSSHTHCSAMAASACERLGIYILRPPEHKATLLANAQYDWLMSQGKSQGWEEVGSAWEAQKQANRGRVVVAVYKEADANKPGHIAMIRPSETTEELVRQEGPRIIQAGHDNYVDASLKEGFKRHDGAFAEGKIKFFAHDYVPGEPEAKSGPFVIPADINGLKTIVAPPQKNKPLKVAIYDGKGASDDGIENMVERIKSIPQASVTLVKATDWSTIDLRPFDVVVFSGGSGSIQAEAIGEAGLNNVREYVRGGGGYVGVCAGAYLACSNFKWALGILNAETVSSKWKRGQAFVDLELTDEGRKLLGDVKGTFKVRYHNGPIIKPAERTDVPAYKPVTVFRSEIAEYGSPVGVMVNSPAQAIGTFGKGRVFISSPHPENTPGLENLIPRGVLWAAGVDGE
jgi:hypothetical protein